MSDHILEKKISELSNLLDALSHCKTLSENLVLLNQLPTVKNYFAKPNPLEQFLKNLTPDSEYAIKSVIAIGQGPIVFNLKNVTKNALELLLQLSEQLIDIQGFYQHMGGIIGYHLAVLKLIVNEQKTSQDVSGHVRFLRPEGLHLENDSSKFHQAIRWGIENCQKIAMIYPLGGAGDRLDLKDPLTGNPLPAALLPFLNRTLLEGLIRDIQALEYLFFKLTRQQALTPIAIMTSVEKNNHLHILDICKTCNWFGRPPESFYFFIQPVVPVITIKGDWSLCAPLKLVLKPSGHGALWKLAEDRGVFDWLESHGRHQVLIRQINNPLAGSDNTLLALLGIGLHEHKLFGFVSCERLLGSDEGINVLMEKKMDGYYDYCLTNIEYTNFIQQGVKELPAEPNSSFSFYPSNTNILFADINIVRQILKSHPIPGQLINMKTPVSSIDAKGIQSDVKGGRLESTMQNIADYINDSFRRPLEVEEYKIKLRTFIIYNKRTKTISTTKKSYKTGQSLVSTPQQAYYDLLSNHYVLLKECGFDLPAWSSVEEYLQEGPSCIFLFHPALGPLYSIISQKIKQGRFARFSELQLEITEISIENLSLDGSLIIEAQSPLGINQTEKKAQYKEGARCYLRNVSVCNRGVDRLKTQNFWKNDLIRHEGVKIILSEGAEFYAEGVFFEGSHVFEVPPFHCLIIEPLDQNRWKKRFFPLTEPRWIWHYSFDSKDAIKLQMKKAKIDKIEY